MIIKVRNKMVEIEQIFY